MNKHPPIFIFSEITLQSETNYKLEQLLSRINKQHPDWSTVSQTIFLCRGRTVYTDGMLLKMMLTEKTWKIKQQISKITEISLT